jgi:transposase
VDQGASMSLGCRGRSEQQDLWVATHKIARSPGHPFYCALNRLLKKAGFDRWVEGVCAPYYAEKLGRPSIPPGTYFRMLMVGYFEGLGSQRGIAWRCADSLALREFLGIALTENTPDHSSLTRIRQRLPMDVHVEVFRFVLGMTRTEGLLEGKTLAVDATTLESNAAMKSIVRKETGEDWAQYVKGLMAEDGIEEPSEEDVRRYDRRRGGKKVSNGDWESPSDPESRIAKLKDGRTHLAYKAEHAVDVSSGVVVAAAVKAADGGDADALVGQLEAAEENLLEVGAEPQVMEVVADKGYHKGEVIEKCRARGTRTYIPERRTGRKRRWTGKPPGRQEAVNANRRRTKGSRGRGLQRRRSEMVERSFAHVCETGAARRTWLRGLVPINARYLIHVAAYNLGVVMRKLHGYGTPRSLQGLKAALLVELCRMRALLESAIWCIGARSRALPSPVRLATRNHSGRPHP